MFITTSLVFSITCLCVLLHIRSRDDFSRRFLSVLVPLCLQMCLTMLVTYINRVYPKEVLQATVYNIFTLWITILSILLTTVLLMMFSRYLITLLPATAAQRRIGQIIIYAIMATFLFLSLFLIIGKSDGNWITALNMTFSYHFFSGSMLMVILGATSLFFIKKATSWEQKSLLKGIAYSFLPLLITLPLDIIFFRNHTFKLAYVNFSILVVHLYNFINRHYFRQYEMPDPKLSVPLLQDSLGLSPREMEIVALLLEGKTNKEIGEQLFISSNTVKTHVKNIYGKLNISNRIQLYAKLGSSTL